MDPHTAHASCDSEDGRQSNSCAFVFVPNPGITLHRRVYGSEYDESQKIERANDDDETIIKSFLKYVEKTVGTRAYNEDENTVLMQNEKELEKLKDLLRDDRDAFFNSRLQIVRCKCRDNTYSIGVHVTTTTKDGTSVQMNPYANTKCCATEGESPTIVNTGTDTDALNSEFEAVTLNPAAAPEIIENSSSDDDDGIASESSLQTEEQALNTTTEENEPEQAFNTTTEENEPEQAFNTTTAENEPEQALNMTTEENEPKQTDQPTTDGDACCLPNRPRNIRNTSSLF